MKGSVTRGSKFSNSHQTIIKSAINLLEKLKDSNLVNKIVVDIIQNKRSRCYKVKTRNTGTSILLTVKGYGEIQDFYVIGNNLDKIESFISENIN